ncbi:MAG TPA: phosphoglycolate phosphatase [Nevskiaceae bacterium]|nr:phosphoglycolate phosphatase [Nevskiaceae bacterium]
MTRARCVLFDLDGTLVDTAPDLGHAANCVRDELGMAPLPIAQYRPVASAGARGLLGVALGITPAHEDFPRHRDRFLDLYRGHLSRASKLFDGLDAQLRQFEEAGVRWGVVTNKPGWLTRPLLEDLQLAARAACAVSGDDVPKAKPAPDSLLLACRQLALTPADCIYVGDDARDIAAARAAGMRSVAVRWGYFGEGGPVENWGADRIIDHPRGLADCL